MSIVTILLIGLGLSMDASAVSMSNAMNQKNMRFRWALAMALSFGLFQGIMPLIGYFAGSVFAGYISHIDHWIAFLLLGVIGGKMMFDGFKKEEDEPDCKRLTIKILLVQSVATSIDALAIGVSFAAMNVNIWSAAGLIAATTFCCSLIAVFLGKKFGNLLGQKAEIFGGTILVLIGLKILIEHLMGA